MRISIYSAHQYPWKKSLIEDLTQYAHVRYLFFQQRGNYGEYTRWANTNAKHVGKLSRLVSVLQFCLNRTHAYVCLDSLDMPSILFFVWFKLRRVRILNVVAENNVYYDNSNPVLYLLSRIKRVLEFWTVMNSNQIIAESEASRRLLESIGCRHERIRTIPHGVDLSLFHPQDRIHRNSGRRRLTVLFAGGFHYSKGYTQVLEAIKTKQLDSMQFLIIKLGNPQVGESFGALSNVELLPVQSYIEMIKLYTSTDIVLVPSVVVKFDAERSPNVIIEAMAAGCAVVASDIGGIPTYVGDAGILIRSGSSESITQALRFLGDNPSILDEYKRRGARRAVELFDIRKYAQQLLKMCENSPYQKGLGLESVSLAQLTKSQRHQ